MKNASLLISRLPLLLLWVVAPAQAVPTFVPMLANTKTAMGEVAKQSADSQAADSQAADSQAAEETEKTKTPDKGDQKADEISREYRKEIEALQEATAALSLVEDETSANKVAKKLIRTFDGLPALVTGNHKEILALAEARNKASVQMHRLQLQPYFVSSGLQEAWSRMTDAFSRRRFRASK